jgi:hypothetical protein
MKIPNSKLYQKNNERLVPIMHKKAVIVSFGGTGVNLGAPTSVNICFLDNLQTTIKGVPISWPVSQYLVQAAVLNISSNIRCVVDIFDETNISQMIVAYTY